jgi:hypothetical protein
MLFWLCRISLSVMPLLLPQKYGLPDSVKRLRALS